MDPGPVHKRRRPAVACTECRRRKIACDLGNPCGPCMRSNANLRCVYNNYNPSRNNHKNNQNNDNNDKGYTKKSQQRDRRTSNASIESSQPTVSSPSRSRYKFGTWLSEAKLAESQAPLESSSTAAHGVDTPSKRLQVTDSFEHLLKQHGNLSDIGLGLMTDTFDIDMQAFMSDGDLVFPEDGFPTDIAAFDSSWQSSAYPKSSIQPQEVSMVNLYHDRPSATAESDNELLEIRRDDIRALLFKVAKKHDEGGEGESFVSGKDCILVERLQRTISNTEQLAQQEQQHHQSELGMTRSSLRYHEGQLSNTAHKLLPVKTVRDALLNAYFFAFESIIYILDPISFLETSEGFWSRPTSQLMADDDVVACKILVAVSIGCCIHPNIDALEQGPQRPRTDEGLRCASEWLRQRMAEGSSLEPMDVAQILCLLALARQMQERQPGPGGAGRLLENYDPARVGMQLGFHREALSRNSNRGPRDIESRRMLWATMVEICAQVSLDEGLPPPIYPESYDCELPATSADAILPASSSIIGRLARTQRLRLQALHIFNSPGSSATHEQCGRLATDLERACRESVAIIRTARLGGSLTMYQVKSLESSIQPFILALHTRSANKIPSNPEIYYSRCVRMECAARLLRHTLGLQSPSRTAASSRVSVFFGQSHDGSQQQPVADEFMPRSRNTSPTATMRILSQPSSDSKAAASSSSLSSSSNSSSGFPSSSSGPLNDVQDPYISLCLRGHGHTLKVQQQATATLFLDVIDDLEEERFDILHGAVRQELLGLLRNALVLFERRMTIARGTHSTCEYVIFTSAAAYVDALIDWRGNNEGGGGDSSEKEGDIDWAITQAAKTALNVCSQVAARGVSFTRASS